MVVYNEGQWIDLGGVFMFLRVTCKECNQKRKDELYQIMGALANREKMQIEEKGDEVCIYACPQGTIHITEDDDSIVIEANTRHGGPGFHAFAVEFCCDLQEESPGKYEVFDDLEYETDHDFNRLCKIYEDEITYLKDTLLKNPEVRQMNYMYESTYILPLEQDGMIPTALGNLDIKEFANMSEAELMDYFFVWNEWDKNARYYKNAALLLLAKDHYTKYPLMTEASIKVADTICDYIELAYQWNPDTPLPVDVYRYLCEQLGRENQLKQPVEMEQEPSQYRSKDVYHLWQDFKVVADGAALRSIDPVNEALCLSSPYLEEDQWDWFIMASHNDTILQEKEALLESDVLTYGSKKIAFHTYFDTVDTLEAYLQEGQNVLYFHCVMKDKKDENYLKQCIKESGFLK